MEILTGVPWSDKVEKDYQTST